MHALFDKANPIKSGSINSYHVQVGLRVSRVATICSSCQPRVIRIIWLPRTCNRMTKYGEGRGEGGHGVGTGTRSNGTCYAVTTLIRETNGNIPSARNGSISEITGRMKNRPIRLAVAIKETERPLPPRANIFRGRNKVFLLHTWDDSRFNLA